MKGLKERLKITFGRRTGNSSLLFARVEDGLIQEEYMIIPLQNNGKFTEKLTLNLLLYPIG